LVLLPHVYPVAYKEWPAFEYLNSNYGANLGVSEMKMRSLETTVMPTLLFLGP
jgi:hypothetical protein